MWWHSDTIYPSDGVDCAHDRERVRAVKIIVLNMTYFEEIETAPTLQRETLRHAMPCDGILRPKFMRDRTSIEQRYIN